MPGLGEFLFRPMAVAVAFAMVVGLSPFADAGPRLQCAPGSARVTATANAAAEGPIRRGGVQTRSCAAWGAGRLDRTFFASVGCRSGSISSLTATVGADAWLIAVAAVAARRRSWRSGRRSAASSFPEVDAGAFEI